MKESGLLDYEAYLFDLDGVLWKGMEPVPGTSEVVNRLKNSGKSVRFVTNNAGTSRGSQHAKLRSMGFDAQLGEVITSGYATAQYLKRKFESLSIFVMGTDELAGEMIDAGHKIVGITDDIKAADCVVVGYDPEFNYQKLDLAFQILQRKGTTFVATNENPTIPKEDGLHPGVGPSLRALAYCSAREPDLVVGKPHAPMMEITLESIKINPNRCLMTGDMIDLDLVWAERFGIKTLFVLSGVHSRDDLVRLKFAPDHILGSVAELYS